MLDRKRVQRKVYEKNKDELTEQLLNQKNQEEMIELIRQKVFKNAKDQFAEVMKQLNQSKK